ncbi:probable cyclic nucleotide-gated ion channel 20, chloroplastic isoform X2 [Macadamia integrifolia]|uniref:probable cyclic nucleotide-gated ion channel 20, chloroplastic isoform X2 n=1 Tax=Macadamia integrifolia TaxID=60698 RepID=UPI001C4E85C2|nr:probable cyclic nucleotide-gated ion channel 20, chloroplastic isoform X2 [Macadamia integrifolia]
MDGGEKDNVPILSETRSQIMDAGLKRFTAISRSASMSIPMNSMDYYENENIFSSHTGPLRSERRTPFIQMSGPLYTSRKNENLTKSMNVKMGRPSLMVDPLSSSNGIDREDWPDDNFTMNAHLLRSGPLGVCNDPYCITCPTDYNYRNERKSSRASGLFDYKFHNALYGDAKGWARRFFAFLYSYIPGVMNPHAKVVQRWNKFFLISCLLAIFVDPLFFFVLTVQEDHKCIVLNSSWTTAFVVLRSMTDFIYLLHMLLQFRLAYVAPESRVVGAGDLVDHPKKIALHYLSTYFLIDVFVVLPLPQIIILLVLPKYLGSANYAKNLLRASVLLQYIPRFFRFLPLASGQSPTGFIFESAWANFVLNLLIFVLAGHVVGSSWYLLGLQRVNQCLRKACSDSKLRNCTTFIDCGHGENIESFQVDGEWKQWTHNANATDCLIKDSQHFNFGIYSQAVKLTTEPSILTRYVYSLFWGFQQISTLAGNQIPSYFVWEVLFTMGIIGLGLLLFALLIGNMQNFLQSLGRRELEMQLRRRDVERWMSHRRLPVELRRQVTESERFNWAATQGVNEEVLLQNLPEHLQREIRRHLFKFLKKVRIFALMDDHILDAIRERLRQKTYIKGSKILNFGDPIETMVFIVRGKMESIGEDRNTVPLSIGDVCGEELLTWCLENSSVNKDGQKLRMPGRLLSNRMVRCLTNVEAFSLRASDLEEVTGLFARFLRNSRVQGAIRYESPYWRGFAATGIQVAWRYRKKRLNRLHASNGET